MVTGKKSHSSGDARRRDGSPLTRRLSSFPSSTLGAGTRKELLAEWASRLPTVRTCEMNPSGIAILTASTLLGLAPSQAWASRGLPSGSGTSASQRSVTQNSTIPTHVARAGSTGHGAGNGYVLMIHSTFEPHSTPAVDRTLTGNGLADQLKTGVTYASGAGGATRNGSAMWRRRGRITRARSKPAASIGYPCRRSKA
jgi:hypothetical protein